MPSTNKTVGKQHISQQGTQQMEILKKKKIIMYKIKSHCFVGAMKKIIQHC